MGNFHPAILTLALLGGCGPAPIEPIIRDTSVLDTGSPPQEDFWDYEENYVDVLVLVDNSPAMAPLWDTTVSLVEGVVAELMTTPSEWIWHFGVVTMDMDNAQYSGQLQEVDGYRFIPRYAPGPDQLVSELMDGLVLDGGQPRARDAANAALVELKDGINTEFFREDAALLVVYVGNDSDYSTLDATGFQTWLETVKWPGNPVRVYGALSADPPCPTAVGSAMDWSSLATVTGGSTWSICNGGFADLATLMDVGAQAWPGYITPSKTPDPSTLAVRWELNEQVKGLAEGVDWVWNEASGRVEFLAYGPPDEIGTRVVVSYLPL